MKIGDGTSAIIVNDWILADTDDIAEAIIEASGRRRQPVALVFEKPEDFEEYRKPDNFYFFEYEGMPAVKMPSSYTDASFLEARLADMGYTPDSVSYGRAMPGRKNFVMFKFVSKVPEKK